MLKEIPNQNYYHGKLNESVVNEAVSFVNKTKDRYTDKSWECDIKTSFSLTDNILNCRELSSLRLNVLSELDNFMYSREVYFNGYIIDSWINIYEKNFYQEFHRHVDETRVHFSGVLYLSEKNSDIEFDVNSFSRIKITPQLGDIIIFDDNLLHRVCSNQEECLRVSLAFNFVKKRRWSGIKHD